MKPSISFLCLGFLVVFASTLLAESSNSLSANEETMGFELLFDGVSFEGWKHAGNWKIVDGVLTREGKGGSLVYVAKKVPDDFELRFEWKVATGSNSGVYYRPGQYEYQILDNAVHADGKNPRTSRGVDLLLRRPLARRHQASRRVERRPNRLQRDGHSALAQWRKGRSPGLCRSKMEGQRRTSPLTRR